MDSKERLSGLRERIDETDRELVALFKDRMEICREIARVKKEAGLPIENKEREEEVLKKLSELADMNDSEYVRALYEKIFELSKAAQRKI